MATIEFTEQQVIDILKWEIEDKHESQREFSKLLGVDETYISHILKGRKKPGKKVLDYLGIKREVEIHYYAKEAK